VPRSGAALLLTPLEPSYTKQTQAFVWRIIFIKLLLAYWLENNVYETFIGLLFGE
jgi:hypothetical protein